jgi:hypothetical protein
MITWIILLPIENKIRLCISVKPIAQKYSFLLIDYIDYFNFGSIVKGIYLFCSSLAFRVIIFPGH